MLRNSGIKYASEKIGPLIDSMSRDKPAETMSDDKSAFLLWGSPRSIAVQRFEEVDQSPA
jgi:hypothetical protein